MVAVVLGVLPRRSVGHEKYGTTSAFIMGCAVGMRIGFRSDIGNDSVGIQGGDHHSLYRESGMG